MASLSALLLASALVAVGGLTVRAATRRRAVPASCNAASSPPPAKEKRAKQPLAAPWMEPLYSALNHGGTKRRRSRSEARRKHVQLATVDPISGRPSVRTVVFRGFLPHALADPSVEKKDETCCLMFITDDRSAKYRHLGGDSTPTSTPAPMEACWWLDEAAVQFRISGHAVIASARSEDPVLRAAAVSVWERLGDSTKRQFFWPAPGEPRTAKASEADETPLDEAHFSLLLLVPEVVDELHLGGNHKRIMYTADDGEASAGAPLRLPSSWREQAVNP